MAMLGEKILACLDGYTMTMEMILNSKTESEISVLRKTEEKGIVMFIAALVKEYSNTVRTVWGSDFTTESTKQKGIEVAVRMMNEFYFWKLEEFAVFFRNAGRGMYDRPMGNVDLECLIVMGAQYCDVRGEYLSKIQHNKIFATPDESKPIEKVDDITDEKVKEIFIDIKKKLSDSSYQEKQAKITKGRAQMIQDGVNALSQQIIKDFQAEARKQKTDQADGQIFIKHDGRMMTCGEYLEYEFAKQYKKP